MSKQDEVGRRSVSMVTEPRTPLRVLAQATELLGGRKGWRLFDEVRGRKGEWPAWCHCPLRDAMDALMVRGVVKPEQYVDGMTIFSGDDHLVGASIVALAAWRPTKGVYRFDSTLLAELEQTPVSGDLPAQVLLRLPEWCVYVELEHDLGYWAHLDYEPDTARNVLRIVVACDGEVARVISVYLGGSLEQGMEEMWQRGVALARMGGLPRPDGRFCKPSDVAPMISALLYLCTEEPDLRDASGSPRRPTRILRQGPLHSAQAPVVWEIGWRLGPALRRAQESERAEHAEERGVGARRRGHIRRAHWHSYWMGTEKRGDRRRELRWLPPIAVALELEDGAAPFATVRPVDREKQAPGAFGGADD